jgi:hypothetical protein
MLTPVLAWRIIGKDFDYDLETTDEEREIYTDLHYGRFTYYPVHERPRLERDAIPRRCGE